MTNMVPSECGVVWCGVVWCGGVMGAQGKMVSLPEVFRRKISLPLLAISRREKIFFVNREQRQCSMFNVQNLCLIID